MSTQKDKKLYWSELTWATVCCHLNEPYMFRVARSGPSLKHRSLPVSNPLRPELKDEDKRPGGNGDSSLNPKSLHQAVRGDPWKLDVSGHKSTHRSGEGNPSSYLTRSFWVRIEEVRIDGGGDDHIPGDLRRPENGDAHVMPGVLQRDCDHDEPKNQQW